MSAVCEATSALYYRPQSIAIKWRAMSNIAGR